MDANEVEDSDPSYEDPDLAASESTDISSESDSEEDFDDTDSHYTKSDSDESYMSDIDLDVAYAKCMLDIREASDEDSDEDGSGDEYLRQHTKPFATNTSATESSEISSVLAENGTHLKWQELNALILVNDGRGIVEWFSKKILSRHEIDQMKGIFSPLYRAARCGSLSIFNFLLGEGFPHNMTMFSLVEAARCYNGDIMERLVELGVDVNSADSSGFTALHAVAREETFRPKKTKFLLSKGAEVDKQDEDGMTPLHYAVLMGCKGNVLELLRAGASVNLLTRKGRPVLHMAVYRGFSGMSMVAVLYKAGARPGISHSYCEIEAAVKTLNINVLRFLIRRNAPVKRLVGPENVITPSVLSHCRCGEGASSMIDIVLLLMAAGAKVEASVVVSFSMDPCEFCSGSKLEMLISRYHNARSLQEICCLKIRDRLLSCSKDFSECVEQLCVPDLLKEYIKLNHVTKSIS